MLVPTDVRNPETGGPLYLEVCRWPLPWWSRWWRWACLFSGIVWRRPDARMGRMGIATAWAVGRCLYGRKKR
jgi:hypothetical protein